MTQQRIASIFGAAQSSRGQAARELRRAANHGAVIMAWGRLWAVILLIFFSAGALVTLAGVPIQHLTTAVQHGQSVNITEAIVVATIVFLVIGMDLAMVIAAMMIRALVTRGKHWLEVWPYLLIVLFVGISEALTFGVMTANNEHPVDGIAWTLVAIRAVGVPVCAVFLSLVGNLPITPNDVRAKLQIEAGQGLMAYLEEAVQTGKADPSALFAFFGLVNDVEAMHQPGWETRVQEALSRLTPDAARGELERRVVEAERNAKVAIARSKEDAIEMTSRALVSLLAGGMLPAWLLEARPELAEMTLAKRAISRGKAGSNAGTKQPQSRTDAMRFFLASLDISAAKAPDKKRGIWVKSPDIVTLSGDLITREEATKMAQRLGDSARDGLPYVAPLEAVMRELIERHKLAEEVAKQWSMVPQSGSDSDEKAADNDRELAVLRRHEAHA